MRTRTGNRGFKQFTNQVRVMNLIQVYIRHSASVVLNCYTLSDNRKYGKNKSVYFHSFWSTQTDTCTHHKARVSIFNCVCCVFLLCFSEQSKVPQRLLYYTTCVQIVTQGTPLCCNFYGQFFVLDKQ